ncbi:hypothetical protein VM57_02565 [Stenotrophomonas maltophilia]|uniref:Uncharacterized protein n=1 Tax=Stenotrophomonas maltophilia TaxID=40324 RepID=A0A0F5ZQT8_STEMA|nr:hypothetical protein VM57_02565 [Stenotrophomonas maltophilia]
MLRDGPFHEISGTTRLVSTAREPDWHSEESVHPNDDVSRTRVEPTYTMSWLKRLSRNRGAWTTLARMTPSHR